MAKKETRAKIEGVGKLKCRTEWRGRGRVLHRKVITNGVLEGEMLGKEVGVDTKLIEKLMRETARVLRAGYEVRFDFKGCGGIRLYPCLEKDFRTMFVAADTMGEFRKSVSDLRCKIVHRGDELDPNEARERSDARVEQERLLDMEHVTPDTVVTCPNCGAKFRVGKALK